MPPTLVTTQKASELQRTTRPDGYREFWLREVDTTSVPIFLQDYTGRMLPTFVHESAVLLMVPMPGGIGSLIFEPSDGLTDDGTHIWCQRVQFGEPEIIDLATRVVMSLLAQQRDRQRIVPPGKFKL